MSNTDANDTRFAVSRRHSVAGLALFGVGSLLMPVAYAQQRQQGTTGVGTSPMQAITDEDIFNFALNLEYMEAEFYLRATTGSGIADTDAGSRAGKVTGGHKADFKNDAIRQFVEELAENELAHVKFYRQTLGEKAVSRPTIDFEAGFKAAAQAAGLPADLDPFADDESVLLAGMMFEDVGVTAYKGAAPLIKDKKHLEAAAGILAVEAYHMGMARSQLYIMGSKARDAAAKISTLRDKLDGAGDADQPLELNGKANFVPSDKFGIAFSRTPQQVLHIVYGTEKAGSSGGGFYPDGFNGKLKST